MKKTLFILASLAFTLGIASCDCEKKEVKEKEITAVTVSPSEMTLKVGESKKLEVTWTPKELKATPTYTSDKPEVATVSAEGEVKAIAEGTATITVKADKKEATCVVTVKKEEQPAPPKTHETELPLLKFAKADDADILAHEAELERKATPFTIGQDAFNEGAFVNKNLEVIPAVVYAAVFRPDRKLILAYSKETLDNFPKTREMLEKAGFSKIEEKTDPNTQEKFYSGTLDNNPLVFIQIAELKNEEFGTNLELMFVEKNFKVHDIIPTVKDFPSWTLFQEGKADKIKKYEQDLGFRDYFAKSSDEAKCDLIFGLKKEKTAESNITRVLYLKTAAEGKGMMAASLNCLKEVSELGSDDLKKYLAVNGYDKEFIFSEKNEMAIAMSTDQTHSVAVVLAGGMPLMMFMGSETQSAGFNFHRIVMDVREALQEISSIQRL